MNIDNTLRERNIKIIERAQRKLAAIVAADVVGYSRLVGEDEEGTLETLRIHRQDLFSPLIKKHDGRIANTAGDSMLIEFRSVVDAVRCVIEIQLALAERNEGIQDHRKIELRIGINLGDVVADGDDMLGDGVNIAARLEALCDPGGLLLSDDAYRQVRDRVEINWEDSGEQKVKNISRPVQTWRWKRDDNSEVHTSSIDEHLSLPAKPSIAVLPFNSFSSDPEQEFFSDGVVEDLITALSRFQWLFVIARNSSFSYKGKHVQIKQVAEELGVRYVVEGSVRSSPTRLRVAVQLIDAINDHHVWAENYDRPTGDLFDLQDEITQSIIGVLVPELSKAEMDRSLGTNRPNLNAWQAYQRGLAHFYRPFSNEDHAEARRLFDRSVELDPRFSDAHGMIALMGIYARDSGQSSYDKSGPEILDEAERSARSAVQLGDRNALAHLVLGRVYGHRMDFESGIAECEIAVRLNPNLAISHHELGFILVFAGRYEEAISCFDKAIRLSPNDPSRWNFYLMKGIALYGMENFEDAIICHKDAARQRPTAFWPLINLTACLSALGQMLEADSFLSQALERKPDLSMRFFLAINHRFSNPPNHLTRWVNDLSKAGLPE
jgi:adenylate cyclase